MFTAASETVVGASVSSVTLVDLSEEVRDLELSFVNLLFDGSNPPNEVDESERTEAFYNGTRVWIEWKLTLDESFENVASASDIAAVRERVRQLVLLLKCNNKTGDVRAPRCLGYFEDESDDYDHRFGLVFEKPASVPRTASLVSLHDMLLDNTSEHRKGDVPSLTHRLALMRILAENLERAHSLGWLHKDLRSNNILFFKDTPETDAVLSEPYISGFDYSRLDIKDDLTITYRPLLGMHDMFKNIYRHTLVLSEGNGASKITHDWYSFGIVLLEIALWMPIDSILMIDLERARFQQVWLVKERLLKTEPQHLKLVRSLLGNTVESVIRVCLEGSVALGFDDSCDEDKIEVKIDLKEKYHELVVEKLVQIEGV